MKRILLVLVALNLVVMFHEGSHYLAMRSAGVVANEISLGMGWELLELGHLDDGTPVKLRILPIGGYVLSEQFLELHEQGLAGAAKSSWIAVAGPLGNEWHAFFVGVIEVLTDYLI